VKVLVVLGLERDEEREDRIPRIGSPRPSVRRTVAYPNQIENSEPSASTLSSPSQR